MRQLSRYLLATALLAASTMAHAGAWTLKEGTNYSKVALNYFEATDTFGQSAEGFEEFTDFTINYYGEFGLTDKLTLITQVPLRQSENDTIDGSTQSTGIGDVDIGLRYNLLNDSWVVSTQLLYKAPFLYDENDDLPLGNGQSDLELRLQLGRSLHPYGYLGLEAGYRYRAEDPSDEWRFLAEYGFDLTEKFYLRTKVDVILATQDTDVVVQNDGNPLFPSAFDLGRLELSAGYKFANNTGVEFTFTESLFGENILDGDTYQLGFVFSF